ncbi:hypothetical protein K4K61_001645, partial [Colletotrichum sp. SAR11_59]
MPLPKDLIAMATAAGYKQGAHKVRDSQASLEKYVPNTLAMHANILNRFTTWNWHNAIENAKEMNTTPPDFDTTRARVLGKNAPAPGLADIKDFFRFYIACSRGRITTNGKPTAESMVSRAEEFYRAFTLETGTETEESQHTEIYRWIRCVLTAEGVLEDRKKPKHNLDRVALDRLLHVIWHDLIVPHERMRIQLHLLLILYVTTGARVGGLFERYTEVERCQHLTQTDRNIFGSSYVANCSSVDGLGAFLGEQADHSAVNFFQGIEKFRETGAPNVLPAAIEKALWQKREVVDLEEQISLAVTADHKTKLSGNLRNLRRKLKATALAEYRDQWVRDRRDWKLLTRGKVSPGTSTSDGNLVVALIPELERVERLMLSTQPLSSE